MTLPIRQHILVGQRILALCAALAALIGLALSTPAQAAPAAP
ncbi:hypothetical protein [Streptomyces coerulescens]|uniref:Uncharacterized protein n=1 Tax=Streptomyces coerulescens TaxID=29304 RepID=A0ABW0CC66_STRCD